MKIITLFIILILSIDSIACPDIQGRWKSSKELSMKYNLENANLTDAQTSLLNQIYGILEITYTPDHIHEHGHIPVKVQVKDDIHDFIFEESVYPYKIINCRSNTLTIESKHPFLGTTNSTVTVVNNDLIWLSSEFLPEAREYFIRIQPSNT